MSQHKGGTAPRPTEMYVSVPARPDPNGNRAERRAAKRAGVTRPQRSDEALDTDDVPPNAGSAS